MDVLFEYIGLKNYCGYFNTFNLNIASITTANMRAGFISYFYEIAEEEFSKHDKLMAFFLEETGKYDHDLIGPFVEQAMDLEKVYIKVIVFLATYLDSFIWDMAATYLGEKFAEKLDKLGPIDKWDVIPRMVLGQEFTIKPHHRAVFKTLITERNQLIHHKSVKVDPFATFEPVEGPPPKILISFWERVDLMTFFELCKTLTTDVMGEVEKKYPINY